MRKQYDSTSYFFNTSIAIDRFIHFAEVLNRRNGFLFGMNYSKQLGDHFLPAIEVFYDRIRGEKYFSDAFVFYYDKPWHNQLLWKIKRKIRIANSVLEERYLNLPINKFDEAARTLIYDIFYPLIGDSKKIVLDQAINPWNISDINPFFSDYRCIIVNRDPRDVFADYKRSKDVIWTLDSFISNYKDIHDRTFLSMHSTRTIFIQFEDFVLKFKDQSESVDKHLGFIRGSNYIPKYSWEASRKNIGKYKKELSVYEIKRIESDLYPYCYI